MKLMLFLLLEGVLGWEDICMKLKIILICGLVVLLLGYLVMYLGMPDGYLHVKALDIGQGDATLIETPEGKHILIDGGLGTVVLERLSEEMGWFERTIDMMILTHPDGDHMDGLVEVLKRYDVKMVLFTGVASKKPTYEEFMRLVALRDIPFEFPRADRDYLIEPDVYLDILYPSFSIAGEETKNLNDSSIALRVLYGDTSMMITGDAEKDEEMELVRSPYDLRSTILKAGHHGSKTSTSVPFFFAVQPEEAFVSAGKDNSFGHPHQEVTSLFEKYRVPLLLTSEVGTIRYRSDGKKWTSY